MFTLRAELLDGRILQAATVTELPMDEVVSLHIICDFGVSATLIIDLDSGERAHAFLRQSIRYGAQPERISVPVVELQKDSVVICRMYLHPDQGLLMTTKDLYF